MPKFNDFARPAQRFIIYALLSCGLFYYAYKYDNPDFGGNDYYAYYKMYVHPLQFNVTHAARIYRQLNAVLVHFVWKSGFFYDMSIAFHRPGYDQRVFFAAILTNWIALVGAAVASASIVDKLIPTSGEAWPLLGGLLCFFDFFAQQGVLGGLSEGVSWLLVALGFLGYVRRSLLTVCVVLVLSVIQRETIPIVFAAFATCMTFYHRSSWRFHASVALLSVAAFALYILMRVAIFPASGNEEQLSPTSIVLNLSQWTRLMTRPAVFQIFLTQNLLIGLAALAVWRVSRKAVNESGVAQAIDPALVALYFAALVLIVVGAGTLIEVNDIGRVLAILTPIAAPLFAAEMARSSSQFAGPMRPHDPNRPQ